MAEKRCDGSVKIGSLTVPSRSLHCGNQRGRAAGEVNGRKEFKMAAIRRPGLFCSTKASTEKAVASLLKLRVTARISPLLAKHGCRAIRSG
ncbi:MAG: hypothetical protein R3C60_14625 [Parvularculaceae bacterium]